MNHTTKRTKTTTLGIAATIVVLAVLMVAATPLVTGHNAFAGGKVKVKYQHKVEVGDTQTESVQAADNSQHCAFGPGAGSVTGGAGGVSIGAGASADACLNAPINTQTQDTHAGSTGAG